MASTSKSRQSPHKTPAICYGWHTVLTLLQKRPALIQRIYLARQQDSRTPLVLQLAQQQQLDLQTIDAIELDHLAGNAVHQGIVAQLKSLPPLSEADLKSLLPSADHAPAPLLLILDNVQDPHNLGACLRSANAAGADVVIAPKDRAVGMTPVVRKVASGAAEMTPFVQVTNLARTMRELKQRGIWLYGASEKAQRTLYQVDLTQPVALVLGSEGKGLRRLTQEHCDELIRIPMTGVVSSLNVSVAAAICLFEAVRQRGNSSSR